VQGAAPAPESDRRRQREVVDAFFAAARGGDFEALVALLDPEVVLRSDLGAAPAASVVLRGAERVAAQALMFAGPSRLLRPALVNGAAGVVVTVDGRPVSVMDFTVAGGRIVAIDALGDPQRLSRLDLAALAD
jgi:RNA polymerase sigma-70 factor (ECF subfamily)